MRNFFSANKEVNYVVKGENFHVHLRDHISSNDANDEDDEDDDEDHLFNCW